MARKTLDVSLLFVLLQCCGLSKTIRAGQSSRTIAACTSAGAHSSLPSLILDILGLQSWIKSYKQQVRADTCNSASLLPNLDCLPLYTHIITHCSTKSASNLAVLYSDLRLRLQLNRHVKLLAEMALDAGDLVVHADLAPLRSLGPGESEGLATDPPLLAGSGGRQPPLAPPNQHSGGQVGDLAPRAASFIPQPDATWPFDTITRQAMRAEKPQMEVRALPFMWLRCLWPSAYPLQQACFHDGAKSSIVRFRKNVPVGDLPREISCCEGL